MRKNTSDLENILRKSMVKSGLSTYMLAKISGVPQAVIFRFIKGQRGINLSTASKLVEALGLELRPKKKKGK